MPVRPALRVSTASTALLFLALASASPAAAQSLRDMVRNAGVGASVGVVAANDDEVSVGGTWGITFGSAPSPGWGIVGNLGWFEGDLELLTATGSEHVGTVRVRPVMAGVGYTWMRDRLATTAALTAGISFNSASLDGRFRESFPPGTTLDLEVDNSFAVRPSVKVEYELAPKVGLFTALGYVFTKIDSRLVSPLGTIENRWNASHFTWTAGAMFYPFR